MLGKEEEGERKIARGSLYLGARMRNNTYRKRVRKVGGSHDIAAGRPKEAKCSGKRAPACLLNAAGSPEVEQSPFSLMRRLSVEIFVKYFNRAEAEEFKGKNRLQEV